MAYYADPVAERLNKALTIYKVGPEGYTHGWVFHGVPGSRDHVDAVHQLANSVDAHGNNEAANAIDHAGRQMSMGRYNMAQGHLDNAAFLMQLKNTKGKDDDIKAINDAKASLNGLKDTWHPPGESHSKEPDLQPEELGSRYDPPAYKPMKPHSYTSGSSSTSLPSPRGHSSSSAVIGTRAPRTTVADQWNDSGATMMSDSQWHAAMGTFEHPGPPQRARKAYEDSKVNSLAYALENMPPEAAQEYLYRLYAGGA
jgi:hypothetical protein